MRENYRNIAIIAHVDHGKTTLVDAMIRQSGIFRENETVRERVMDSNDLERERGITILAKNLSVRFGEVKINIVDTPGHADFGGEVERILRMVDAVLLLVDAVDGPMPQTRFVLKKSLELGLRPILVVNKVDRPGADPLGAQSRVFDLFCDLAVSEDQLDFPTLFTDARRGTAVREVNEEPEDLRPLFETIRDSIRPPEGEPEAPFQMLVSHIDYNEYLGRTATGKVSNGRIHEGDSVVLLKDDGQKQKGKVLRLLATEGLRRVEVREAACGDIVTVAGLEDVEIGDTISVPGHERALPYVAVDEPTLAINIMVNASPFAGREGRYVTSRNIRERLHRELRNNLSLRVEDTASPDTFRVSGRGELHLGILLENMRREGFELAVSKPEVIFQDRGGVRFEPVERLVVDIPLLYQGAAMACIGPRRAELLSLEPKVDQVRLEFSIPARGLIGLRGELLTETRGTAVINHVFDGYGEYRGDVPGRRTGALVSMESGAATAYALEGLQERGRLFIKPGTQVYAGMIVGENSRENDLDVNPVRTRKLTNMRSSNAEMEVRLTPPAFLSLEQAMEFIDEDELVEITPEAIRLRKRELNKSLRTKRAAVSQ